MKRSNLKIFKRISCLGLTSIMVPGAIVPGLTQNVFASAPTEEGFLGQSELEVKEVRLKIYDIDDVVNIGSYKSSPNEKLCIKVCNLEYLFAVSDKFITGSVPKDARLEIEIGVWDEGYLKVANFWTQGRLPKNTQLNLNAYIAYDMDMENFKQACDLWREGKFPQDMNLRVEVDIDEFTNYEYCLKEVADLWIAGEMPENTQLIFTIRDACVDQLQDVAELWSGGRWPKNVEQSVEMSDKEALRKFAELWNAERLPKSTQLIVTISNESMLREFDDLWSAERLPKDTVLHVEISDELMLKEFDELMIAERLPEATVLHVEISDESMLREFAELWEENKLPHDLLSTVKVRDEKMKEELIELFGEEVDEEDIEILTP